MAEPRWYALYVRSRSEKRVAERLQEKQVDAFLPLVEELHTWSDRTKAVMEPLFRGYVFVRTDLTNREAVLNTEGVVSIVGIRQRPSPIPDVQIESLRIVARYPSRVKREQRVIRGQRVRVIAGPCEGVEGIVTAVRGESRVVVMVDVISQSVSVMVTAGCLEEIGAAESCPAA